MLKDNYNIFEDVPADASMPYIVLGEATTTDNSTKTEQGAIISLSLHVFSGYPGYKEIASIIQGVLNVLEYTNIVVDGKQIWIFPDNVELADEPPYKHGIIRLKIHVYEGV